MRAVQSVQTKNFVDLLEVKGRKLFVFAQKRKQETTAKLTYVRVAKMEDFAKSTIRLMKLNAYVHTHSMVKIVKKCRCYF